MHKQKLSEQISKIIQEHHIDKFQERMNKQQSAKFQAQSDAAKQNVVNNMKQPAAIQISNPASSSIIKIVPNNLSKLKKVPLPQKCSVKTFIISRSSNEESKSSPSTSTSGATDHEYVCKDESTGEPVDILYLNENQEETDEVADGILQKESDANEPKIGELKRQIEDDDFEIPDKISKVHSENCCSVCRDTLESILQKQEEILCYLKNGPPNIHRDSKFDLLPPMPFNDLNDFLDFDESLSNENVLDQLIAKLQRLLVSIDKKSVSNIMSSILTNDLCKRISWIGIKDTIAFQNTNMVNHIIDVIQDHHGLDVDIIKSFLAEWLRRCSDRIASEVRKSKKRAQQFGYDDT